MKKQLTQALAIISIALFSLIGYADEITPIVDIKTLPIHYDGKQVNLQGIVKDPTRIPLVPLKAYVLKDNSGEITILTEENLPAMGKELTIRVQVENLAVIMGEAVGQTVVELERYEYY